MAVQEIAHYAAKPTEVQGRTCSVCDELIRRYFNQESTLAAAHAAPTADDPTVYPADAAVPDSRD